MSVHVPELGKGALDPAIIRFCRDNRLMWVTKDWQASVVDERVRLLKQEGVSAWWLRPETRKNLQRPEMLYAAARDIESVLFAINTETPPIFVTCSVALRVRHIQLPYLARRHGPPLTRPAKRRAAPKPIRGQERLFKDV